MNLTDKDFEGIKEIRNFHFFKKLGVSPQGSFDLFETLFGASTKLIKEEELKKIAIKEKMISDESQFKNFVRENHRLFDPNYALVKRSSYATFECYDNGQTIFYRAIPKILLG